MNIEKFEVERREIKRGLAYYYDKEGVEYLSFCRNCKKTSGFVVTDTSGSIVSKDSFGMIESALIKVGDSIHCIDIDSIRDIEFPYLNGYTIKNGELKKTAKLNAMILAKEEQEANSIIKVLSDERDAEIISDDDLARWKAWVKYRKALRETDMSHEDVEWPDKPE